ncbi:MAG: thioredoxin domain-containing protein [Alphaproteobacteria bacterium]|nr:thioredoxin domain-containing protein [Alphaproteobacteria bacterium]
MRLAFVLLTAALAAVPAAAPAAPVRHRPVPHRAAAPAARDWSRTVAPTPEGGFRMGNPAARVKVVEYGSLACPHCRHFEQTGYGPLVHNYVRRGRVSYEFRNLIINAPDISVSLLARCAGPANFFAMSAAVYAGQPQWMQKLMSLSPAQKAELEKMSDAQRILRFAAIAGFPQVAARYGVTPARARQCLANPAGLKRLLAMADAANRAGVDHTPTFFVNGAKTEAATWEQLEPVIRKAGG